MYKSLLILLFSCSFCSISAENLADSVFVDSGIAYKKNADNTVNIIAQDNSDCYKQTFNDSLLVIPSNVRYDGKNFRVKCIEKAAFAKWCGIKSAVISEGIEEIHDVAFFDCANLESINIPSSVNKIGEDILSCCIRLNSIKVDKRNPIYDSRNECNAIIRKQDNALLYGCKSTIIPSSVITMKSHAFLGCMMETVSIPVGVKIIEPTVYTYCVNLKKVKISSSVEELDYSSFYGCNNITSIEVDDRNKIYDSREGCNAVIETNRQRLVLGCSSTKIPAGVEEIGENSFRGCENLREIVIPEGVDLIDDCAFKGCSSLKKVSLPSSLNVFYGNSHFSDCISLESIHLPANVYLIPNYIFKGCVSLREIVVDKGNALYDSRNNCNAVIRSSDNQLIAGCKTSVIVDGIKSIGAHAFRKHDVTSIFIPASVEYIDSTAFLENKNCKSIMVDKGNAVFKSEDSNSVVEKNTHKLVLACSTTKILPEVTSIGAHAYLNTPLLIVLPDGIKTIRYGAFMECADLNTIFIPSSVERIERFAFAGCENLCDVIQMGSQAKIDDKAFDRCIRLRDSPYSNAK